MAQPAVEKSPGNPNPHTVAEGETLGGIAGKYKGREKREIDWLELAGYNWGVSTADEINRALAEQVGCAAIDKAKPEQSKLDPKFGPAASPKLVIVEPWRTRKELPLEKLHTIKVKKRLPPPAIRITRLDKWFLPGFEACQIDYELHGIAERADTVDVAVYASNYCEATVTAANDGDIPTVTAYAALNDEPVFKASSTDAADADQSRNLGAKQRVKVQYRGWEGQTTTTKGVLKKGTAARYISVANSPYTLVLRYYKKASATAADAKARITLTPFWPTWTPANPKPTLNKPLKIEWRIEDCDRLKHGLLTVYDKDDNEVFRKGLDAALVAAATDQSYSWDGKGLDGKEIEPAKMPYRVQIEAHTDMFTDDGVALAARQTEVRLFVHGETGKRTAKGTCDTAKAKVTWKTGDKFDVNWPTGTAITIDGKQYVVEEVAGAEELRVTFPPGADVAGKDWTVEDPSLNPPSLGFGLAPFLPEKMAKAAAEGSYRWYKLNLAAAGFHPGPAHRNAWNDELKVSLLEFQRSHPKVRAGNTDPYERQKATGDASNETKAALKDKIKGLAADSLGVRPLFGNPADRSDLQRPGAVTRLTKPDKAQDRGIIVWVDDRQYTTACWADPPVTEMKMNEVIAGTVDIAASTLTWKSGRQFSDDLKNREITLTITGVQHKYTVTAVNSATEVTVNAPPGNHNGIAFEFAPPADGYRGGMGDRAAGDKPSIPRPWLPLWVTPLVMTRDTALDATAVAGDADKVRKASLAALGPIRIDWTFTDVCENFEKSFSFYYTNAAHKDYIRSKSYVKDQYRQFAATHNSKPATNCTVACGGIRPDPIGDYALRIFGVKDQSLYPQTALAKGTDLVCSVAHAEMGQDAKLVYDDWVGKAGVYLRPSTIAGDGYRLRAEVSFEDMPGGGDTTFPNWKVLKARYEKAPQAHSCEMRVWRKDSWRAYILWGRALAGLWATAHRDAPQYYLPAYVHFVDESGAAKTVGLRTVFDPTSGAKLNRFKKLWNDNIPGAYQGEAKMSLHLDYACPWGPENQFGILNATPAEHADFAKFAKLFNTLHTQCWFATATPIIQELLAGVERDEGLLRGHFIVEFDSSPKLAMHRYNCTSCKTKRTFVEATANYWQDKTCSCGGSLKAAFTRQYKCPTCNRVSTRAELDDLKCGPCGGTRTPAPTGRTRLGFTEYNFVCSNKVAYGCPDATAWRWNAPGNEACRRNCDGTVAPQGAAAEEKQDKGRHPWSALGLALGSAWLFTDTTVQTWSHECGHQKFTEHAEGAPGWTTYHCHDENAIPNYDAPAPPTVARYKIDGNDIGDDDDTPAHNFFIAAARWDVLCVMTYHNRGATDHRHFCGSCILKQRGWAVVGTRKAVAAGLKDD